VGLGQPEGIRDLELGAVLDEPHLQDALVSLTQPADDRSEDDACLSGLGGSIFSGEQLTEGRWRALCAGVVGGAIEGGRGEAAVGCERLDDGGDVLVEVGGEFAGRGVRPICRSSSSWAGRMRA
jgi:hypothetical protein